MLLRQFLRPQYCSWRYAPCAAARPGGIKNNMMPRKSRKTVARPGTLVVYQVNPPYRTATIPALGSWAHACCRRGGNPYCRPPRFYQRVGEREMASISDGGGMLQLHRFSVRCPSSIWSVANRLARTQHYFPGVVVITGTALTQPSDRSTLDLT